MRLDLAPDHLLLDGQRFDWSAASIDGKLSNAAKLVAAASEPDHPEFIDIGAAQLAMVQLDRARPRGEGKLNAWRL